MHFVIEPSQRARTPHTVRLRDLMEEAQRLEIGARIRALRERSPYKQPQVAEKLGIGLRAYQKVEEVGTTRYERCEELAKIFDVDPRWLWDGSESRPTPDLMDGSADHLARVEAKLDQVLGWIEHQEAAAGDSGLPPVPTDQPPGEEPDATGNQG